MATKRKTKTRKVGETWGAARKIKGKMRMVKITKRTASPQYQIRVLIKKK